MSAILGLLLSANSLFSQSLKDTIFNRNENNEFAFGADISWLSQLESWGTVFRDDNGVQKDLMVIIGMSAYPHWAHLDSKTEIDRKY